MRLRHSAKEWVLFIVGERFDFLSSLDSILRSHARESTKPASRPPPAIPPDSSKAPQAMPPSGLFKGPSASNISASSSTPPAQDDNSRTFSKGCLPSRLQRAQGAGAELTSLLSSPPGDFSFNIGGSYFTKQRQVAWQYSQMAAHFVDGRQTIPVAILSIKIPNDLLSSAYQLVGDEWRRFV